MLTHPARLHFSFLLGGLFVSVLVLCLMPDGAWAGQTPPPSTDSISNSLCTIIGMITGTAGRAIASLAVIIVGLSSLLGRVQWQQAIIVCIGISVIFGAPKILNEMIIDTNTNVDTGCSDTGIEEPGIVTDNPIAKVLCNVVEFFSGKVGKAVATLGVIILGLMALFGKISPPYALMVGIGVAVIFGATKIVTEIAPSTLDSQGGIITISSC